MSASADFDYEALAQSLDGRIWRFIRPGAAAPVDMHTTAELVGLLAEAFGEIRRLRHEGYDRDAREEARRRKPWWYC